MSNDKEKLRSGLRRINALEQAYKDTIWMARRYAAGRSTHAPATVDRHIKNVEKVCGIKVEPDSTIVEDTGITLTDQHPEYSTRRKAAVTESNSFLFVEFAGYNNCSTCDEMDIGAGERAIALFEVWEGELCCLVWTDINQEDPTHIISLEKAKVTNRKGKTNE